MVGQKEAKGLRYKAFPHYDNFVLIYGEDTATGGGVEGPADVCDAMEDEEGDSDDDEESDNEEVEKPEDEEAVEVDQGVEVENAFGASAAKPQSKEKSVISKKRTKSDDGFGQLMTSIGGLCEAYNKKNEAVTGIASYFLTEKEEKDRMMQLNTEIRKLEGLTRQECRLVAQHIIKSPEKIDMFFSLLEDEKTEYVQEQLSECCTYRPTIDFGGGSA
ncbi:hypothetical protein COLO4_21893 [Corchorus olitorius]|uniref:Uncharacterized protein n=1 Tax=Corchorus olitorius TaxID=93759 RepID=A0A1R3IQB8_9ROSI|nr:hypothetical protein COLO4_21893 [Corchorus olitorius]